MLPARNGYVYGDLSIIIRPHFKTPQIFTILIYQAIILRLLKILRKLRVMKRIILLQITLLFLATTFTPNPPSGWYQQFMPFLNKRPISDITFIDSLTGYAITGDNSVGDTNFVIKTTNGGDNWNIIHTAYRDLSRVIFLNPNTGFVCGGFNAGSYLIKTTDGGNIWNQIITPEALRINDMSIISKDTMRIADKFFAYNLYLTTNGGANWLLQHSNQGGIDKIYFVNNNLGFFSDNSHTWRTTNRGWSWTEISSSQRFRTMYFTDSLTGWKTIPMKKTTDGGLTWTNQYTATGGYIQESFIYDFSNINEDTIWGSGGYVLFPNNQTRHLLHRTTNGGNNWFYQIPDTSIRFSPYFINFYNGRIGWAYDEAPTGIHTVTGGDTVFLNIKQISTQTPEDFHLFQNYPNPFNPITRIKFALPNSEKVKLIITDLLGRELFILVNEKLGSGSYEYTFDGSGLPSGVYFYSLITKKLKLTKKMLLTK